jgi:hypothetical protein
MNHGAGFKAFGKKTMPIKLIIITAALALFSGCAKQPIISGDVEELEIADKAWDSGSKSWVTQHQGRLDIYEGFAVYTAPDGSRSVAVLNRLGKVQLKK